jgi:hypothetical protein
LLVEIFSFTEGWKIHNPGLQSGASGTQMSIRNSRSLGLQSGDFILVGGNKKACTTCKTFAFYANDLHQMQNKNHPLV